MGAAHCGLCICEIILRAQVGLQENCLVLEKDSPGIQGGGSLLRSRAVDSGVSAQCFFVPLLCPVHGTGAAAEASFKSWWDWETLVWAKEGPTASTSVPGIVNITQYHRSLTIISTCSINSPTQFAIQLQTHCSSGHLRSWISKRDSTGTVTFFWVEMLMHEMLNAVQFINTYSVINRLQLSKDEVCSCGISCGIFYVWVYVKWFEICRPDTLTTVCCCQQKFFIP